MVTVKLWVVSSDTYTVTPLLVIAPCSPDNDHCFIFVSLIFLIVINYLKKNYL